MHIYTWSCMFKVTALSIFQNWDKFLGIIYKCVSSRIGHQNNRHFSVSDSALTFILVNLIVQHQRPQTQSEVESVIFDNVLGRCQTRGCWPSNSTCKRNFIFNQISFSCHTLRCQYYTVSLLLSYFEDVESVVIMERSLSQFYVTS